ncbi:uncharacterized protein LOC131208492 [Anopheles bellator]|uniref:uncharacterized protein LOC131208492 n=1 Tax=Anopheles bellator TaxID=139047 RepID=UPI0026481204|nr:uncharacterized protein LOC131208492 [Anopheles bellator]
MQFQSAIALFVLFQIVHPAPNDGKYNPRKYNKNGKYVHQGEGDYVEDLSRYKYVHYDDGDRGRYFHVHIPYDGGYGNYEGGHEPYRFPPYDPAGEYAELISKYSSDPLKANSYDIQKPSIYLEYGVPSVSETNTASSVLDVRKSLLPGPGTGYLPVPDPSLDVRKSLLPGLGTAYLPVLGPDENSLAIGSSQKNSKFVAFNGEDGDRNTLTTHSDTTTTTTINSEQTTPTTDVPRDESLHNQPCFATSGTLQLSKT